MIIHIMKDGKKVKDITGHLVKREDVPRAYDLMSQMNRKGEKDGFIRTNPNGK